MHNGSDEHKGTVAMEISAENTKASNYRGDAIVVGIFEDEDTLDGPVGTLAERAGDLILKRRQSGEIRGTLDELTVVYAESALNVKHVLIAGLGKRSQFTPDRLRRASAIAARRLRALGVRQACLALARSNPFNNQPANLATAVRCQAEGAVLGLYRFDRYKTVQGALPEQSIEKLTILSSGAIGASRRAVELGRISAEAENFARDLCNEPANVMTPAELAIRAQSMAAATGLDCEILLPEQMRQEGMGALLAVGNGSINEPRFIVLQHWGEKHRRPGLALVGKGITFDSGGISIKPAADMDAMKMDMSGGAAVIGAMQAIARLKVPRNVTGIIAAAENMPSRTAYRPGDIIRALNGKTIEILNTDAEGRLVLADALAWAVRQGHTHLIDLATLTGAIVVALGHSFAGLFSNSDALAEAITAAGNATGERVWRMPLDDAYDTLIQSHIADVKQTGGRAAGAIIGAKVLSNFVGDARWAHLDIAGVNALSEGDAANDKGATGFGVRLLTQLVHDRDLIQQALRKE